MNRKITNTLVFILGILAFFTIGCAGGKTDQAGFDIEQDPPFTLGDVYYQDWVAGVKDGGSGTNVHIAFESFEEDVVIMDVYFRKKIVRTQRSPQYRNQYVAYFKKDGAPDRIMDIDPLKEAQNTPARPFPFDLKDNEAILSYLHQGKTKYTRISNIRREEMLAYPSVKPKGDN